MGMSASDAAPLPRLGEIFFDVRGSSRSMRLSWYSNTGVAVFSIWQGGTCTGTFRLPMDDLTRLVDSLRRGVPGDPADGDSGPMVLGGQRPRLAIGAAPAEPFTGMMNVLTDEQAAAYGRSSGRRTGGFATNGTDSALGRNGAEPVSISDYAAGARAAAVDQYGTGPLNGTGPINGAGPLNGTGLNGTARQYEAAQQYAATEQYGTGQFNGTSQFDDAAQQYGSPDQYGSEQYGAGAQYDGASQYGSAGLNGAGLNGTAQQYGQYGQAQQYGAEAGRDGQSRPGADGQAREQRADYQYGAEHGGAQYGASGYGETGYDTGYGDTASSGLAQATVQPGGYARSRPVPGAAAG